MIDGATLGYLVILVLFLAVGIAAVVEAREIIRGK